MNGVLLLDHDEHRRPGTTVDTLAALSPSFAAIGDRAGFDAVALQKYTHLERVEHVHHAGNSSGIVDGAALTLIGNRAAGERLGLTPRARIVSTAVTGAEPTIMLTGPTPPPARRWRRRVSPSTTSTCSSSTRRSPPSS